MRHLTSLCIPACEQHTRSAVRAPVFTAARTIHPSIAGLALHILFRRRSLPPLFGASTSKRSSRVTFHRSVHFHAQLFGQPTGKRQTEADDAARITLDPLDERAARKPSRVNDPAATSKGLAGSDVPLNHRVRELAEVQRRFCTRPSPHVTGREINQAVAGPQLSSRTAHLAQAFTCDLRRMWLAVCLAVEQNIESQPKMSGPTRQRSARALQRGERLLQRLPRCVESRTREKSQVCVSARSIVGECRGRIVRSHGVKRTAGHALPVASRAVLATAR